MRVGIALFILVSSLTIAAERALLWRDPGAIETMNMVAGPEGFGNAPVPPFRFVAEETRGVSPKLVVLDAGHVKWMVKFGEEAKAEIFASRISWAAGYPVRASYYVGKGRIEGISSLKKAARFVGPDGVFQQARFQKFDHERFREISGGKLDLYERRANQRELNGLKLTLLLVANWDVKSPNTGIFEINGQRYAAVTDWGASMGDPAAIKSAERKWNCSAYSKRTKYLMDGVENGYVQFNYTQYAARHENALSYGIRIEHLRWFLSRMQRLTDTQVHAALLASGATAAEASCFTQAFRERLNAFAATAGEDSETKVIRSQAVTKTTTTSSTETKD